MVAPEVNISCAPNSIPWPDQTAVMAEEAGISFFAAIRIYGHYFTFVITRMFTLKMVKVVAEIIAQAEAAKMFISMCLSAPLQKMPSPDKTKQKFWKMGR